jgi:hypothetical protein
MSRPVCGSVDLLADGGLDGEVLPLDDAEDGDGEEPADPDDPDEEGEGLDDAPLTTLTVPCMNGWKEHV